LKRIDMPMVFHQLRKKDLSDIVKSKRKTARAP